MKVGTVSGEKKWFFSECEPHNQIHHRVESFAVYNRCTVNPFGENLFLSAHVAEQSSRYVRVVWTKE